MTAAIRAATEDANRVLNAAIAHALFGSDPLVIVESPPGAGKTFLVECAVAVAVAEPRMRVVVVTPGVSQAYDVVDRLLDYHLPRLELAHAQHRTLPDFLIGRITAARGWNPGLNQGAGGIVTHAHLLQYHLDALPTPAGVYDMIYNPPETTLLRAAKTLGLPCANGLSMLVHQGAKALEIWSGTPADVNAPIMAAAVRTALGR